MLPEAASNKIVRLLRVPDDVPGEGSPGPLGKEIGLRLLLKAWSTGTVTLAGGFILLLFY